jgi:hypothetical protein
MHGAASGEPATFVLIVTFAPAGAHTRNASQFQIAASILDRGPQAPIRVGGDGARFVLAGGSAQAGGRQRLANRLLVDVRKH